MSMRSSSAFEKFRLSASLPLRQLGASRSGCTQARHSPASSRRTIVACGAGEPENAGTLCEFARRRAGGFAPASPRGTRKPAPSVDRDTQSATRRGAGPPAAAPGCPKRLSERREARFIASSHALPRAPRVRRLADPSVATATAVASVLCRACVPVYTLAAAPAAPAALTAHC